MVNIRPRSRTRPLAAACLPPVVLVFAVIATSFREVAGEVSLPEDNGQLGFSQVADLSYDSNIFGRAGGDSDLVFVYSPSMEFVRKSGLVATSATLGGNFGVFANNSQFNYENLNTKGKISFPNEASFPYSLELEGGYRQDSMVDRFAGGRIDTATSNLDGRFRYNVNDLWALSFMAGWSEITYQDSVTQGLFTQDQASRTAGLDFIYIYSEKLELSLGYRYRSTQSSQDFRDHLVRLGAEGELTPKLKGRVEVGYQIREASGQSNLGSVSTGDPFFGIDLTWDVNERTQVALQASWDFQTTLSGESGSTARAGLALQYKLTDTMVLGAGISYMDYTFDSRDDQVIMGELSLTWKLRENLELKAGLSHEDNQSSQRDFNFNRLRAGISLTHRF